MKCDFCLTDVKDDFLGREKVDENEIVFLCQDCKEKIRKLNVDYGDRYVEEVETEDSE
jgi:hypothetical protein